MQYGIFEVPDINIGNINDNTMEDDDNDESLEAELAALAAGNDTGYKSRRSGKLVLFYKSYILWNRNIYLQNENYLKFVTHNM